MDDRTLCDLPLQMTGALAVDSEALDRTLHFSTPAVLLGLRLNLPVRALAGGGSWYTADVRRSNLPVSHWCVLFSVVGGSIACSEAASGDNQASPEGQAASGGHAGMGGASLGAIPGSGGSGAMPAEQLGGGAAGGGASGLSNDVDAGGPVEQASADAGEPSSPSSGACGEQAVVCADFNESPTGTYSEGQVEDDFGGVASWNDGLDEGRAAIVEEGDNRFLRVTYPAGQYGPGDGGVQFKVAFETSYEALYLSYRVRFRSDFDFVKGGKLPGLVGGTAPTGCRPDADGFSARNMWRREGAIVQYLYYPTQPATCGHDRNYNDGEADVAFEPGTWHTVVHRLVMNDVSGASAGEAGRLEAWVDGVQLLDEERRFREAGAEYGIDSLYFSTFFGGGDDTWAPGADQVADFDDFYVSEQAP